MRIEGRCHCGNLGFALETALTWATIRPRECDCSFCRAHATRCVSDPEGRASIFVADPARLVRYTFGLRTAEFLLCSNCGVYIGAWAGEEEGGFATLNLRATADRDRPGAATSYGRETAESRRARRRERWTPAELRLGVPPPAAAGPS